MTRWKEAAEKYIFSQHPQSLNTEYDAFQAGAAHGFAAALEECAQLCEKKTLRMSVDNFPWSVGHKLAHLIRALAGKEKKE